MAVNFLLKRTATASKRPEPSAIVVGELAVNYSNADGGLFYKDSAGGIIKVGPAEVGSTAPNLTPAGSAGNSLGELWYDTTPSALKIWTGSAWEVTSQLKLVTPPTTSTSPGRSGDIASDATYFYMYTGTRWQRIAWDVTAW